MADEVAEGAATAKPFGFRMTVDWWAVLLAFVLAALVKFGALQTIGW